MEFREFIYILKVAEEKSFSTAAKKLFITQPSLSQYIIRVEENLGVRLFDRSSVPITLTYAGEQFIEMARDILNLRQQLQKCMDDIANLKNERITIGISQYRGKYFLPKVLPAFQESYPGVEVVIREDSALGLENLVHMGEVDFSIQILPIRSKGIKYTVICEEDYLIAVSPQHAINVSSSIDKKISSYPVINLSDLQDEKFILLKPEFPGRTIADRIFEREGFYPKSILETRSLETAHALAASGFGVAFVSEILITYCAPQLRAKYFFIKNCSPGQVVLIATYKENAYLSKATLAFLEIAKQVFK